MARDPVFPSDPQSAFRSGTMPDRTDASAPAVAPVPGPAQTAERQDAILDAAIHAFAAYGYRRTAMDDIARGAGLSRSALYLHFRNKEDIFRSLAQRHFAQALRDMAAALAAPGPDEAVLTAAFRAKDGKFMDLVLGTPHGAELMDAGLSVAADLARRAEAEMAALLSEWFDRRPLPDGLGPPDALAQTVMAALSGVKSGAQTLAGYQDGQARLAGLVARALAG